MTKHKIFFSSLPIEFYVVLFPVVALGCYFLTYPSLNEWSVVMNYPLLSFVSETVFNNQAFKYAVSFLLLYILFRHILQILLSRRDEKLTFSNFLYALLGMKSKKQFFSSIFWLGIFALFLMTWAVALGILSHSFAPERIINASTYLMRLDHKLFGSYPEYAIQWLGFKPPWADILIFAYIYTPTLMGAMFVVLLFLNTVQFRKFFLTTALALFLAYPLWYAIPALTPNEMYRLNIFSETFDPEIANTVAQTELSTRTAGAIEDIERMWIDPKEQITNKSFSVSTMPSMHIIWGMELAYFAYFLWKKFLPLILIYFFSNLLATLLLLQHYAVDIMAAFIVGILSFVIANMLLHFDKWYFKDNFGLIVSLSIFTRDSKTFIDEANK